MYSEIVVKTHRQAAAKIVTHQALTRQELPIPLDLDNDVAEYRRIAQTRTPARDWVEMQEHYPELIPYLLRG